MPSADIKDTLVEFILFSFDQFLSRIPPSKKVPLALTFSFLRLNVLHYLNHWK